MEANTVYRLVFEGKDYYFGSIAAIYDVFTPEQLKVGKERLWNYGIEIDKPYKGKNCTIYKGQLHRKRTGRKRPERDIGKNE